MFDVVQLVMANDDILFGRTLKYLPAMFVTDDWYIDFKHKSSGLFFSMFSPQNLENVWNRFESYLRRGDVCSNGKYKICCSKE